MAGISNKTTVSFIAEKTNEDWKWNSLVYFLQILLINLITFMIS